MIRRVFRGLTSQKLNERLAELERSLMRREAQIGGRLFGPVPAGTRREFFCLDDSTWVWHEEWIDTKTGNRHMTTTRYDVRPDGILKSQNGHYQTVSKQEAERLLQAAQEYQHRVTRELYSSVA